MPLPHASFLSANLDEYADPVLYDLENPEVEAVNTFLLALAREVGGPLLELGCGTGRFTIPLARRRFFPQELEMLLHYNGFVILQRYGNWERSLLTDESPMMIYVCRQQ